ncbi:ORF1255 [White spot syndrome virus]|uniref:ORF1255 n=1 Tax=White spot syndrome virus TaxID=342409 RepID=A0A2D3I796_9VIRU|nr:ORF1255 [White spot syndrome virus]
MPPKAIQNAGRRMLPKIHILLEQHLLFHRLVRRPYISIWVLRLQGIHMLHFQLRMMHLVR